MQAFDPDKYRRATAVFKLGVKASAVGVHMRKPAKVREAIEHFEKAYEIFPDIAVLTRSRCLT